MRKKEWIVGLSIFCLGFGILSVGASTYAADKYRLKMQFIHTAGDIMKFHQDFAEKVKVNTGGRIVIDTFTSGSLVPTKEMAGAVGQGTLDMAFCYGGYHSGMLDIANIECGLPMAWGNIDEAARFHLVHGFQNIAREAYAGLGVYWMTPIMEVPFLTLTKKPVRSLADLKPMKIRATATVASILKPFGIATVYMPAEEFYTSMATGVIDGCIYGSENGYYGLKLQEQAPYITDMKILNPMTSAILINQKVWDSMPADLKGILDETVKSQYTLAYFSFRSKQDAAVRQYFKREQFSPEDVAKMTTAAQQVWETEAKKSPRAAKGIELLKALAKEGGRL